MSNCIDEIIRFGRDRGLDGGKCDVTLETSFIIEELLELRGFDSLGARRRAEVMANEMARLQEREVSDEELVDGFCDIIIFAIGAIEKLGYVPEEALTETAKELNSREGKMVDGKFTKDDSVEALSRRYIADYTECKYKI